MGWIVVENNKFTKELSKLADGSELRKYNEWRALVGTIGPHEAARDLGYRLNKLNTGENQWELYVGSRARVSFSITKAGGKTTVTLLAVGHT